MNIQQLPNIGAPAMPNPVDLAFAVIVFVIGAALDYFLLWPSFLRNVNAGDPRARTRVYAIIMAAEWLPTVFVLARWRILARPWEALWLLPPHGWRLLLSVLFVLAVLALFLSQTRALARLNKEKRAALRSRTGSLMALVPHTLAEYRWFVGLSLTAGVCEEFLYRGFLMWLLQQWLGLGWAALISVIVFGAAHAYQGKDVVRPTLVGAVLQGIALLTASILPGILMHAIVDVMSGTSGYLLLRDSASPVIQPTPSTWL
jgi:membrane protease YdiL (CAAX protease family)